MNKELNELLHKGAATVTFTKKDGTERVMKCTLSGDYIPPAPVAEIVEGAQPKKTKKENPDVRTVYDIEARAWRSFRWDSVKSFEETV